MGCFSLDSEKEEGVDIIVLRVPPPRTDGVGHERDVRRYVSANGLDSQRSWCVTGISLVELKGVGGRVLLSDDYDGTGYGALHLVRGCTHVISVNFYELWEPLNYGALTRDRLPFVWPTRLVIPPRQNFGLVAEYMNIDEASIAVHWARDAEIDRRYESWMQQWQAP